MQTVTPLTPDQQVQLRIDLASPRLRIEAAGRIAWTDSWGQAGVQFVDLPERSQRLLKEWVFIQILSAAYLFAPSESAAVQGNRAEGVTELLFSAAPRPAIQIEPQPLSPTALPDPEVQPATLPASMVPSPNFAEGALQIGRWSDPVMRRPALCRNVDGHHRCSSNVVGHATSRDCGHSSFRGRVLVPVCLLVQEHTRRASGEDGMCRVRDWNLRRGTRRGAIPIAGRDQKKLFLNA